MKLMEWANLKDLYKRSRKQPNKRLFKRENARRLWTMWTAAASTLVLCVLAGWGIKNPAIIPYTYIALVPWTIALYVTRIKALRTVYPQQFADHAIDRQSSMGKENILCYAFFLENAAPKATRRRSSENYQHMRTWQPNPPGQR